MTERERQLRSKLAKAVEDARAILDKAEKERRALRTDEEEQYSRTNDEIDNLSRQLEIFLKSGLIDDERRDAETRNLIYGNEPLTPAGHNYRESNNIWEQRDLRYEAPSRREAFSRYLRQGVNALSSEEYRALQADSDTAGGYLVLPMALAGRIIKAVDNEVFIRQFATIFPVPASESLGAPALDNDMGDPTWTAELGTGDEDSTMSLGLRQLTPSPIARRIKVSNKLLRLASISADNLVADRLAYKFGTVMEYNYLLGDGAGKPMGVFTAAPAGMGISTSRDVSTGNTATAITADGLIEAFYSLKAQYRKRAVWILHRDVVKKIRKLKDGDGNYIWQLGIANNKPETILGRPYCESEYAPNTFTASQYVGIIGDFSHYWIADGLQLTIQRLVELYAATNQVGFIGRVESDGMPVLEEAFARVKLAAA